MKRFPLFTRDSLSKWSLLLFMQKAFYQEGQGLYGKWVPELIPARNNALPNNSLPEFVKGGDKSLGKSEK